MSIYSDKLTHVQVIINCISLHNSALEKLAYISGAPSIDDAMSYNLLTTSIAPPRVLTGGLRSLLVPALKNPDIKTQCLHFRIKDFMGKKSFGRSSHVDFLHNIID